MTGVPAGSPMASAASAVSSPSALASAARAPGARRGRRARPASSSRPARPSGSACSRTGGSRPGAAIESTKRPGQPVGEIARQEQVVARSRAQTSGSFARSQFASQSAWKRGDGVAHAERRKARPVSAADRPAGPRVRRWSSQTIAGRSGRPSASVTTTVPRWVVSVGAGDARPACTAGAGPQRPARLADRAPVELRVLLGPAGLRARRTARSGSARPRRGVAARVERERADALRPDVDRDDDARRSRRRVTAGPRARPGSSMPSGSNRSSDAARARPSRARPSPRRGTAGGRARRRAGG